MPRGVYVKSPEHRAKMAAAAKGRRPSPETLAKLSRARKGRVVSAELRSRISAALTGRPKTPEAVAHMTGHPKSAETRAKIGAGHRGKKLSPKEVERVRTMNLGNRAVRDAPVLGDCAYCLQPATTRDHMIPRGQPGWDDPDNVVLACRSCNTSKGKRTPAEWWSAIVAASIRIGDTS